MYDTQLNQIREHCDWILMTITEIESDTTVWPEDDYLTLQNLKVLWDCAVDQLNETCDTIIDIQSTLGLDHCD